MRNNPWYITDVSKPFWRSKTLWVNTIAAALIALEASTEMLQPLLPVNFYAAMTVALTVINAGLRVITSTAVTLK